MKSSIFNGECNNEINSYKSSLCFATETSREDEEKEICFQHDYSSGDKAYVR